MPKGPQIWGVVKGEKDFIQCKQLSCETAQMWNSSDMKQLSCDTAPGQQDSSSQITALTLELARPGCLTAYLFHSCAILQLSCLQ